MAAPGDDDLRLTALAAPVRNRWFAGQLLTADDLAREQDYVRGAALRLGRLALGPGVVAGLDVSVEADGDDARVVVTPGVAVDGWGRPIVVGEATCAALAAAAPVVVLLAHVASDDGGATTVESFRIDVVAAGEAPPAGSDRVADGRPGAALRALAAAIDPVPPDDPRIVLAAVRPGTAGAEVDAAVRQIAPTNRVPRSAPRRARGPPRRARGRVSAGPDDPFSDELERWLRTTRRRRSAR